MASLATLRSRTRRLINESDTANTNFDDDELNDYLNQATLYLGTVMEWPIQTSTATSVLDQALYTLPENFIALTEIYLDEFPLIILSREDMKTINPAWQQSPSGTPTYAYKSDNAVFGLWPAPDSSHDDLDIQIQYVKYPDTLSSDSDIPDLHEAFQLCLPFYAAFLCEAKAANDKKAQLNLQLFESHKNALKSRVQRFSDDNMRFKWPR